MVQIKKLSVVFILAAAAIVPVTALPMKLPFFSNKKKREYKPSFVDVRSFSPPSLPKEYAEMREVNSEWKIPRTKHGVSKCSMIIFGFF
jgi:hypothetical protein